MESFGEGWRPVKATFHDRREKARVPCPHYPYCFGCALIEFPYPEQLQKKRERLVRAFAAYPSLDGVEVLPVIPSPKRFGYRARVKLVVRKTKGEVAAGLYVPGSHRVVDISSCPVHPRPVNQVVAFLKRKILGLGIVPYDERYDTGQLRYLDLRYGFTQREMTVTLVTRQRLFPEGKELARSLKRHFPFVLGVIQNVNEQRGNVIWGERFFTIAGQNLIVEKIGTLQLGFPAGVFSQANPSTAAKIYGKVIELAALTGKENVVDLYCGAGPLALHLSSTAAAVWGIDDSEISIATAKQNARRNGISNCRFFSGDLAEKLNRVKQNLSEIDLMTLNPPRKGVQPAAMEAIVHENAPRLIYVSCDPGTLARDLNRLVESGYTVRRVQPFDMFPQTEEVETVALIEKR